MRTNVQSGVDRGINFVSLSGNALYAHSRLRANNPQIVMWRTSPAHPNRWPFTAMTRPSLLQNIVGGEVDSPLYSIGPAVEVLADAAINYHGKVVTIMATYYTNSKNARVIDISTNGWTCVIDDICPRHLQISTDAKISARQRI
jgi:hypothetical protein